MQELDKNLYELTRSKYRPVLQEYLKFNKDIVEEHLYHSNTGYIEKPTNGAVVLIKMREVYDLLLNLPNTLSKLVESEQVDEELAYTVDKIIKDMS